MVVPNLAWDTFLDLSDTEGRPLHLRLTAALRQAIEDGRLPGGSALPSSRHLARDLGCSRWVVTEAYGQLVAEGFLETAPRSATRVRRLPSAERLPPPPARQPIPLDLVPGLPDLRAFPHSRWQAAMRTALSDVPFPDLGYPDPEGHPQLRAALAAQLRRTRAADTSSATVLVSTGILDGVVRILRTFERPPRVGVEDPGWTKAREAIATTGAQVVPLPVDEAGLRIDGLEAAAVDVVLVGPAHQFPMGVALSEDRRTQLLAWARDEDGVILEDDYDAEFRYDRTPLPALQGSAPERVVLLGSVSKALSPALGIGWLVAPHELAAPLIDQVHPRPPIPEQLAYAHLLTEGAYDRHLLQVRRRYRARRDVLLDELERQLPEAEVTGEAAGLHLLLHLPDGAVATDVAGAAAGRGLRLSPLDMYRVEDGSAQILVLGYANLADGAVSDAVRVLAEVVRDHRP